MLLGRILVLSGLCFAAAHDISGASAYGGLYFGHDELVLAPAGGFKSSSAEQAACVIDKALHFLQLPLCRPASRLLGRAKAPSPQQDHEESTVLKSLWKRVATFATAIAAPLPLGKTAAGEAARQVALALRKKRTQEAHDLARRAMIVSQRMLKLQRVSVSSHFGAAAPSSPPPSPPPLRTRRRLRGGGAGGGDAMGRDAASLAVRAAGADGDCDRAYADDELRALRGCCASPAGARHVAQWTDVAQCEAALQPAVAAATSFARDFGKCLAQVGALGVGQPNGGNSADPFSAAPTAACHRVERAMQRPLQSPTYKALYGAAEILWQFARAKSHEGEWDEWSLATEAMQKCAPAPYQWGHAAAGERSGAQPSTELLSKVANAAEQCFHVVGQVAAAATRAALHAARYMHRQRARHNAAALQPAVAATVPPRAAAPAALLPKVSTTAPAETMEAAEAHAQAEAMAAAAALAAAEAASAGAGPQKQHEAAEAIASSWASGVDTMLERRADAAKKSEEQKERDTEALRVAKAKEGQFPAAQVAGALAAAKSVAAAAFKAAFAAAKQKQALLARPRLRNAASTAAPSHHSKMSALMKERVLELRDRPPAFIWQHLMTDEQRLKWLQRFRRAHPVGPSVPPSAPSVVLHTLAPAVKAAAYKKAVAHAAVQAQKRKASLYKALRAAAKANDKAMAVHDRAYEKAFGVKMGRAHSGHRSKFGTPAQVQTFRSMASEKRFKGQNGRAVWGETIVHPGRRRRAFSVPAEHGKTPEARAAGRLFDKLFTRDHVKKLVQQRLQVARARRRPARITDLEKVREAEAIAQHTKAQQHLTTVAAMEGKAPIAHGSSEAAATVSPAAAREATVHSFIARHVKHTKRRRHHSSRKHTGSVSVPPPIEKDPAAKEWDRLMGTAMTVHKGAAAQKKAKAAMKPHRSQKALVAVTLPIRVVRVLFRASAASQSFADPPLPVLLLCALFCLPIAVQADDDFSLPGHSSTTLSTRTGNAGRRHRAPPHASTAAPTLPLDLADDDFVKKPPSKPPSATPKKKYKRTTAQVLAKLLARECRSGRC